MSFIQINKPSVPPKFMLFSIGFRPFFFGAAVFASASIFAWLLIYGFQFSIQTMPYTLTEWHAHEMIYGFSMAVITGFLLTAIMNWTGVQTLSGRKLQLLFTTWVIPRIAFLFGTKFLVIAALFESLFLFGLLYAVMAPVMKSRQWKQVGIVILIALLAIGDICFYLRAFTNLEQGAFWGIYGGIFLVVSLILTIGGRVMPSFIQNGVEMPVVIQNSFYLAVLSFFLLLCFSVNYLARGDRLVSGTLSVSLFLVTSYRLWCWHTFLLWRKPLLWGLYGAFIFINLGFLLFALHFFSGTSPFLAIHAFAYGGIGLSTLAMMSRVSVGHTGRNVRNPPAGTSVLLLMLSLGAITRVIVPLFGSTYYLWVIIASQIFWILAFGGFLFVFGRILISPRIDE